MTLLDSSSCKTPGGGGSVQGAAMRAAASCGPAMAGKTTYCWGSFLGKPGCVWGCFMGRQRGPWAESWTMGLGREYQDNWKRVFQGSSSEVGGTFRGTERTMGGCSRGLDSSAAGARASSWQGSQPAWAHISILYLNLVA